MPESVKDRPTKAHEYLFLLTKSATYWYDQEAVREPHKDISIKRWSHGGENTCNTKYEKLKPDTGVGNFRNGSNPLHPSGRNLRTVWTIQTTPYKKAHFATFPPKLAERCIRAGCPAQVCVECGKPWIRITEEVGKANHHGINNYYRDRVNGSHGATSVFRTGQTKMTKTIAFAPTCQCSAPTRPGIVIDPFIGSGTTAQVAIENGRHWLGIELNPEYVKLAMERILAAQPALFAM